MSANGGSPVTREAMNRLRCNRETALRLPAPDDEWVLCETEMEDKDFYLVRELGLIEDLGTERVYDPSMREDSGGGHYRKRWQTKREAYEWVQNNLGDVETCPAEGCHATGIFNPPNEEGYRCSSDECDEELTREQARTLIQ